MVVAAPYGVLATPCSVLANLQVAAAVNHPPKHVASVRFGPGKSEELKERSIHIYIRHTKYIHIF